MKNKWFYPLQKKIGEYMERYPDYNTMEQWVYQDMVLEMYRVTDEDSEDGYSIILAQMIKDQKHVNFFKLDGTIT